MLIGITGNAFVGKDTVADYLWRQYAFTKLAFADPVRRATQHTFGLTDEQTWGRDLKEVVIPFWNMSPRRMMQLVGTEAMRGTFGDDVWIRRWQLSYEMLHGDNVVVSDVRFDNEAHMILSKKGIIIKLERNADGGLSSDAKKHQSEQGINPNLIHHTITNDGTFDELYVKVNQIIQGLRA